MPQVTVLMTVYNGMPYLPLAIESILQQSFSDFELLIINDYSTDHSREAILSYSDPRIRLVDNPENIKQTRSLNRGLELAQTELIARMDADDLSHPQRLAKQVAFLQAHPEVVAVGSNIRYIDPNGKPLGEWRRPQEDLGLRWLQFFSCPISNGAVMFRKSIIWDQLGGFNPDIIYAQDWELWSRIPHQFKLANLPEFLLEVRTHPQAASSAASEKMAAENRQIFYTNPERILGLGPASEWQDQLDALLAHPPSDVELALQAVNRLFGEFSLTFEDTQDHPEVLEQLLYQYVRILQVGKLSTLAKFLTQFRFKLPQLGQKHFRKIFQLRIQFMLQLFRLLIAQLGARQVKHTLLQMVPRV